MTGVCPPLRNRHGRGDADAVKLTSFRKPKAGGLGGAQRALAEGVFAAGDGEATTGRAG
jgi:hypothetical protein